MKTAGEPFVFHSRFVLSLATDRSVRDLAGLRAGIAELPDEVLYHHTHSFLAGHEALVPDLSNDFAPWTADALDDPATAERLAAVDVLAFHTLADLRREFLSVLDEALKRGPGRTAPEEGAFRFMSALRYSVPTGVVARTLGELAEGIRRAGPPCLYLHLYEAKLRGGGGVSDFSRWLEKELKEPGLAQAVGDLDVYGWTLGDARRRLLELLESALKESDHAQA